MARPGIRGFACCKELSERAPVVEGSRALRIARASLAHLREVWRPMGFLPRLDGVTVYAIAAERITGKETALPAPSQQWPALDRTKTPNAQPPTG